MTKAGLLVLLLSGFRAAPVLAQSAPTGAASTPPPVSTPTIEYFGSDDQPLPSAAGADHRVETTRCDSAAGVVRTFYLPSGKLKSYVPYAHLSRHLRHGTASYYYESGQLRLQESYMAGKWQGDLLTYYPDGALKRRDHYAPGQPVVGECFGPDGKPVSYYSYEIMPVYPEGTGDAQAVVQAVMLRVRYPTEALRRGVGGVVKILFVVDKNGYVQHVRPDAETASATVPLNLTGAYQALQEAAMQAVRRLKPFTPGRQDGEPVPVSYTVPVTFRIQ